MNVRWATDADAFEVGELVREALTDAPSSEVEPSELSDEPRRLGRSLLQGPGIRVAVADEGGFFAAMARLVPHEFLCARHVGEVQLLVRPGVRSRGVGARLMGAAEQLIRQELTFAKLALRVAADDQALLALARRTGWQLERVERAALRRGGPIDVKVFARYLDPRLK